MFPMVKLRGVKMTVDIFASEIAVIMTVLTLVHVVARVRSKEIPIM